MARRAPDPFATYRDELHGLLAAIRGPSAQPDIVSRLGLVPVIFANGEDDDLPGLVAAIENRRVQFDDRIYEPGEPLIIRERSLRSSQPIQIIGRNGERLPGAWVAVEWPIVAREIELPGPIACDRSAEP